MALKKRGLGLGRGLDALLGGEDSNASSSNDGELRSLAIDSIQPGKYQPRQSIDPERLEELAASIRAQGVIEPVIVRAVPGGGGYELIAGERRWRATQLAGMSEIPALVRELDDRAVIAIALIENIQREDLSPLEEGQALSRLIDEFDLTHQQAADAVGRSRAAVSNLLRLLELPEAIKRLLEQRKLDMGHARALLTLPVERALLLAQQAAENGWSVRELEQAARGTSSPLVAAKKPAAPRDADIAALERELAEKLCTRVAVAHGRGGRGKLVIHYHNLDTLEGILERLR